MLSPFRWLALLLILCSLTPTYADTTTGISWLTAQFDADSGRYQSSQDLAYTYQTTSEVLQTLQLLNEPIPDAAAAYILDSNAFSSTEHYARQLLLVYNSEIANTLLNRINEDSGVGDLADYASNALDTAFVLQALAQPQILDDDSFVEVLVPLIDYLTNTTQKSDGGWGGYANDSSPYTTAIAMRAIWHYRHAVSNRPTLNVDSSLQAAATYLKQQLSNGLSNFEVALSLIALLPTLTEIDAQMSGAIEGLRQAQLLNGSWEEDVYTTALALRALQYADSPTSNPDLGGIKGRFIDGDTGFPLEGITISIVDTEWQVKTNADGYFEFNDVPFGIYTLDISDSTDFKAETQVKKSQISDLGEIIFFQSSDITVVKGTVIDDEGNPLSGATISLTGKEDILTNSQGIYSFSDVQAGELTFEARKEGYLSHPTLLNVATGQTLVYSPTLPKNSTTLYGIVYEGDTGTPLAQAIVSVQNGSYSTVTEADGTYEIRDIIGGVIEAQVEKAGYNLATGSINISEPANALIEYSPRLYPINEPVNLPTHTSAIKGQVIRQNGYPMRFPRIKIGELETWGDVNGYFLVEGLPTGNANVTFWQSSYIDYQLDIKLAEHTTLDLGEIMLYRADRRLPVGVKGVVLDAMTREIIPYVYVTVKFGDHSEGEQASPWTGEFEISSGRYKALNGTLHIRTSRRHQERLINISMPRRGIIDMGEILLLPERISSFLPDLVINKVTRQTLGNNPDTLALHGTVTAQLHNRGDVVSSPSAADLLAFYDANFSSIYEAGTDLLLGQTRWNGSLAVDEVDEVDLDIAGILPFRDAPIKIWVDSSQEMVELEENNNVKLVEDKCLETNTKVATADIAICLDSSDSVRSGFYLELEGVAQAVENPDIIPHDGSIRLSIFQFSHWTKLEIPPTFITADNAQTIADEIRSLRPISMYTVTYTCVNAVTEELNKATPATTRQLLYIATDGGVGDWDRMRDSIDNAKAAGLDVLNFLSVGYGDYNDQLETIVFPQPAGGDEGYVMGITNFALFPVVATEKLQVDIISPDYSAGRLKLVKNPQNNGYTLSTRIGNGGFADWEPNMNVSFFAGSPSAATQFATVPVAQLTNQAYQDITLSVDALPQPNNIHAVIDWENQVAECDETNNTIAADFNSGIGTLQVSTGALTYTPQTTADLYYTVANQSIFPAEHTPTADYQVQLDILSLAGAPVATLPKINITALTGGSSTPLTDLDWPTGNTLAGHYTLRGTLYNVDGDIIDTDESRFEITAGEGPYASLRTNTDKPNYHTTDAVNISHLVQNLTHNKIISDGLLTLTIQAPEGQTVHTQTVALNELSPQGTLQPLTPYMLREAVTGDYTVLATLTDNNGQLANAQTTFSVQNQIELALSGQVQISWQDPQSPVCLQTLSNLGTAALNALAVRHLLINLDTQTTLDTQESQTSLAPQTSQHWEIPPNTPLGSANYACILQAKWADDWETLDFAQFTLSDFVAVECHHIYGIHDDQYEDSQLFNLHLETQTVTPLGLPYPDYDLEGLDIHPYTQKLYASSGKSQGSRLYQVNAYNGDLTPIGDIGYNEVESLSFHPDGTLWGWAQAGLIQINLTTGQGTLIHPVGDLPHMEGLTWDNSGNTLYATHADGGNTQLYRYDGQQFTPDCTVPKRGIESLESHPQGTLIYASHLANDISLHSLAPQECAVLADAAIKADFNDIEGIAWPQHNCSAQQLALRAFFNAFADEAVFIGEDNQVRVELAGQIHLGRLAENLTTGTPPSDGRLHLIAIPDANQDGQDDYLITYPDGQQQVLFYLGIQAP